VNLLQKLKDHLPESKCAISDDENLLLNRKDYHISQISPVNAMLNFLGVRVSYPYRVLMALLDQMCAGVVKGDFNIVISDPSLTVAGFYCWVRAGGGGAIGQVYAPKGCGKFPVLAGLLGEFVTDFAEHVHVKADSKPEADRRQLFTIVLGNTKKGEQTVFAADRYAEVERGILVLKDYARVDGFDEREYLESKGIFPAVTFEGHAFAIKI